MQLRTRAGLALSGTLVLAWLAGGCIPPSELFNPDFTQALLGGGASVAAAPGEAPLMVMEVENATRHVIEYRLTWRDMDGMIQERTGVLGVGDKYAEAVVCPVQEMTLGDVSNLSATSAIVRLGEGGATDPYIEVDAFGVLLQEGINYNCGDVVTFRVMQSEAALSGYQVFAFVRRAGVEDNTSTGG